MAADKIVVIHNRLDRCIQYACNPAKTTLTERQLVDGINCLPQTALSEMRATKNRWGKTDGVQGYHIIHSYAPGEVTPEQAHALGVAFTRRLLGERYETIVATHLDHAHLHCHIIFNSVSFVDGKKYQNKFHDYFGDIRETSNAVSRENDLSVITPTGKGKHYAEWNAEKQGKPTIRSIIRRDMDAALSESFSLTSFFTLLEKQGYAIKGGPSISHTAVRPPGGSRFIRLDSLGKGYTESDLIQRLRSGEIHNPTPTVPLAPSSVKKHYTIRKGRLNRPRKPHGFRALYVRYMYLLGLRKPAKHRKPVPFNIRVEVTKLEQYKRQFILLQKYRIETNDQLSMLTSALQADIDTLVSQRAELYRRKRRGEDVSADIGTINKALRPIRRELRLCGQIEASIPHIQSQLDLYQSTPDQTKAQNKTKSTKRRHDRWK